MKKLLLLIVVLSIFALTGCTDVPVIVKETEIVEVPTIVTEIEIVEIEVIVKEIEIHEIPAYVEIEVPVYIEVEVPTDVEVPIVSTTLFRTTYDDIVIYIMSRGNEAYVFEFRYTDTITTPPTLDLIEIQYRVDDKVVSNLLIEQADGYEGYEVANYYEFMEEIHLLVDDMTWEEMIEEYEFAEEMINEIVTE